jgi:hypothetical protein
MEKEIPDDLELVSPESVAKLEALLRGKCKISIHHRDGAVASTESKQRLHIEINKHNDLFTTRSFQSFSAAYGISGLEYWLLNLKAHLGIAQSPIAENQDLKIHSLPVSSIGEDYETAPLTRSISSFDPSSKDCSAKPPYTIIIVGTHFDQADPAMVRVYEQEISTLVRRLNMNDVVQLQFHKVSCYPMEDSKELLPGVTALHQSLLFALNGLPHHDEEVPGIFFAVEQGIYQMAQERRSHGGCK